MGVSRDEFSGRWSPQLKARAQHPDVADVQGGSNRIAEVSEHFLDSTDLRKVGEQRGVRLGGRHRPPDHPVEDFGNLDSGNALPERMRVVTGVHGGDGAHHYSVLNQFRYEAKLLRTCNGGDRAESRVHRCRVHAYENRRLTKLFR